MKSKQAPVTQSQGVGTIMEEKTVEPVLKDMTIKSAIAVRTNIMVILIVITVNASQATLWMLPMFVIKKMAPAHVPRVTLVDNVMFVKMGTLVIPPAKVCSYYLFLVPLRFQI